MYTMIATCPDETKDIVADEIRTLGGRDVEIGYRAVQFTCDEKTYYQLHLESRTVSRFLRVVKEVPAQTPDILYNKVARIRWPDLFAVGRTFKIEGIQTERGPDVMPSNILEQKVREGIQNSFQHYCGEQLKVDVKEPQVTVVAFWRKGRCMLSLDSTGKTLHKRGYRKDGHPAPIKETLAAALCKYIGYDGLRPFWDPMCGSGTIAIEAAMIALGKAPQIHRKKDQFGFEFFSDFNRDLWRKLQDLARANKQEDLWAKVYASDIDPRYVEMAKENALRARVEKHIDFRAQDFFKAKPEEPEGYVVTNIPYGERLGDDEAKAETFYRSLGDQMKQAFPGWRVGLLVPEAAPYKLIGLKPFRRVPLRNGSIECRFLIFDIYAGSKRSS